MSIKTTETEMSRAEQQAIAQVDSIVELVRRLDRNTSAEDFVKGLSDDDAISLWSRYNGPSDDSFAEGEAGREDIGEVQGKFATLALIASWLGEVRREDTGEVRENLVEHIAGQMLNPEDYSFQYNFNEDSDEARDQIMDDPLEITYRTGWLNHGEVCDGIDKGSIEECCILLCTGGPAVRILCDVDHRGALSRPIVQYQDWGTPWTELLSITSEQRNALETYISNFEIQ